MGADEGVGEGVDEDLVTASVECTEEDNLSTEDVLEEEEEDVDTGALDKGVDTGALDEADVETGGTRVVDVPEEREGSWVAEEGVVGAAEVGAAEVGAADVGGVDEGLGLGVGEALVEGGGVSELVVGGGGAEVLGLETEGVSLVGVGGPAGMLATVLGPASKPVRRNSLDVDAGRSEVGDGTLVGCVADGALLVTAEVALDAPSACRLVSSTRAVATLAWPGLTLSSDMAAGALATLFMTASTR